MGYKKKRKVAWHPTLGCYYDRRILTVATRRAGTREDKSNIKKLGHKATVFAEMKSIAPRQLSSCKIIAQSSLLRRHGFRVQKEMGLPVEAFRSCHWNMTATLKIMSAYKLNVRGSGRVRCLLKRSQRRKKQHSSAPVPAHTCKH